MNACFLAKRNFQVDVYEAREGESVMENEEGFPIAPSISLDVLNKRSLNKRNLRYKNY